MFKKIGNIVAGIIGIIIVAIIVVIIYQKVTGVDLISQILHWFTNKLFLYFKQSFFN